MNDANGTPWGMCATYGCPLLATRSAGYGSDWFCFCHIDRPAAQNAPITTVLRTHSAIVDATLDIRRFYGHDEWPEVYRGIQKRLIEADRRDMLLGKADWSPNVDGKPVVKLWLARLERELIQLCAQVGEQLRIPATVPTAPVTGPTHAMQHYSETT